MTDFHRQLEQQIPRLRRYAWALVRDGVRADDLVQDTLVRAIAKEHLWQPGTNLTAWLFTLMHNQSVNTVRRARREGTTVAAEQCSELVATTDPQGSCKLRDLDRAMSRLPDEQRQVLLLVGLEGMAYDEAAFILRIPVGTVRSRLSRARESLRRLMDRSEVEESRPAAVPTARAA
jgi:RNA polymerase sigma-70 factor (ECF subfamily)